MPHRIVSLLPAATEIVIAMGLGGELVGRSHECEGSAEVARLPAVTRSTIDPGGSSLQIHQQVVAATRARRNAGPDDALGLYPVDRAMLRQLKPDVILTQTTCGVCAVTPAEVEQAVSESVGSPVKIVALSAGSLAGLWDDARTVGAALDHADKAEQLVTRLRRRIHAIAERTQSLEPRPGVVCLEWIEPLMAAGHWVPELVQLAGGHDLLGRPGEPSHGMEWDAFHEADPEAIVLMPCGFDLQKTIAEASRLYKHPGFRSYRAVRGAQVYAVDARRYFTRPGPRLVESLEILTEILHRDVLRFGHEFSAWRRL